MGISAKERRRLLKVLSTRFPNLIFTDYGAFLPDISHSLRGVLLHTSRFKGKFYVSLQVSVLYENRIFFSPRWGKDLYPRPGKARWEITDSDVADNVVAAVEERVLPVVESLNSLEELANYQSKRLEEPEMPEARYALTLMTLGRFDEARDIWESVATQFPYLRQRPDIHQIGIMLNAFELIEKKDWHGLAKLFRDAEKRSATALGVVEHWKPTLFPFEEALGLTLPEA